MVGGGKIADYLSKGDEKSAVLESLVAEVKPAAKPAPEAAPAEPKPEEVAVKLEELTEEPPPIPVEPEQPAKPRQNDEEINSKLNDILGNRK